MEECQSISKLSNTQIQMHLFVPLLKNIKAIFKKRSSERSVRLFLCLQRSTNLEIVFKNTKPQLFLHSKTKRKIKSGFLFVKENGVMIKNGISLTVGVTSETEQKASHTE